MIERTLWTLLTFGGGALVLGLVGLLAFGPVIHAEGRWGAISSLDAADPNFGHWRQQRTLRNRAGLGIMARLPAGLARRMTFLGTNRE
jgi:hypothetical protein